MQKAICEHERESKIFDEKKAENYQISQEIILNICLFKPYFKKFLVLRKKEASENLVGIGLFCKSMKNYSKGNQIFKFDQIFTKIQNPYEIIHEESDNNQLLNEELIGLISKITCRKEDTKNALFPYFTTLTSVFRKNSNFFNTINQLTKCLISTFTDITLTISLIRKFEISPINDIKLTHSDKEIDLSSFFSQEYILSQNNNCESEEKIVGFILLYKFQKKRQNYIKFLLLDINSIQIIKAILQKLSDTNSNKIKGRTKSAQKSSKKDFQHIFDEIDDIYHFFYSFIDLYYDSPLIAGENSPFIQEILMKFFK
jgi:hypothetical protein